MKRKALEGKAEGLGVKRETKVELRHEKATQEIGSIEFRLQLVNDVHRMKIFLNKGEIGLSIKYEERQSVFPVISRNVRRR